MFAQYWGRTWTSGGSRWPWQRPCTPPFSRIEQPIRLRDAPQEPPSVAVIQVSWMCVPLRTAAGHWRAC